MLARLKVEGFKSLHDIELFFGPFTCFIGPNAAGKSNIFDVIRFLSLLADHPIMEAAALIRESSGRSPHPKSLFTLVGSYVAPRIRVEADLIIDTKIEDDFGAQAQATKSVLRYEVAFGLQKSGSNTRLELLHESLEPLSKELAGRLLKFPHSQAFKDSCLSGHRSRPYISTRRGSDNDASVISLHQEGRKGRLREHSAPLASRTTISAQGTSEFPTVLAARKEMLSWRTLMLEPSAMRTPSSYRDADQIDHRGANLPAAIRRLEQSEQSTGSTCAELANKLGELVEDIRDIRVVDDPKTETLTLEAKDSNGVYHPARSLSDGTLRFLTLAVLSVDPLTRGVLCLEEPENGIHPERAESMVRLLRDIAVDPALEVGMDNPLRQVVINTHSGKVVQACEPEDVIYVSSMRVVCGTQAGHTTAVKVASGTWRSQEPSQGPLGSGHLMPYQSGPGQLSLEFDGEPV